MWKKSIIGIITLFAIIASLEASHKRSSSTAAITGLITGFALAEALDLPTSHIHLQSRGCNKGYSNRNYGHRDGWREYHSDYRDYNYRRKPTHYYYQEPYPRHHRDHYKKKIWVPGHWEYTRTDCGRRQKIWIDGHWEWRIVKHSKRGRGCH